MATATIPETILHLSEPTEFGGLLFPPAADGRARFSREAYQRMFEAGMFGVDPHVELIDGEILMMSPIGPLQGAVVRRLTRFFAKHLPDAIECSVQLPILAGDHSEPQPDIALLRHRDDDYQSQHPTSADIVLLIEVAQSSLAYDLGRKLQVYAACGIPEYWVVDVIQRSVIVHRDPSATMYRSVKSHNASEIISPAELPACQLNLEWLFR